MFTLIDIKNNLKVKCICLHYYRKQLSLHKTEYILSKTTDKRTKKNCHQKHFISNKKHKLLIKFFFITERTNVYLYIYMYKF